MLLCFVCESLFYKLLFILVEEDDSEGLTSRKSVFNIIICVVEILSVIKELQVGKVFG